MKITAIIVAAGSGSRAGFKNNKLLQNIDGSPIIFKTVSAFLSHEKINDILVVANKTDFSTFEKLFESYSKVKIVLGGETRTQSVKNGLLACNDCDFVLIHDGARPFVSQKIITDCIDTAKKYDSAICAIPAIDTTAICKDGKIISVPERQDVYSIQTPQGFNYNKILTAYQKAGEQAFTDDGSLYSQFYGQPTVFLGDIKNKKLTFKEDFAFNRVGVGIDTHAFGKEQNYVVLGGVKIPSDSGLIAHSDGDVLIHAIMDALLSAASLYDIGHYFPDTDQTYKDADSVNLLKKVNALLAEKGLKVHNVSAAIQAQKPKLANFIAQMKENIANALGVLPDDIGISAGTNEGLGYIGEGKGITVTAYVSVTAI